MVGVDYLVIEIPREYVQRGLGDSHTRISYTIIGLPLYQQQSLNVSTGLFSSDIIVISNCYL